MTSPLKIIFMGTPDFAVPALNALQTSSHEIVLVVTQPDRPKGRGRKVIASPVKQAALANGLALAQPGSVRTPDFRQQLMDLRADLMVVIAYGHLLPPALLKIPPLGAVNVHGSLLPRYRGPAPIQWAIINRERVTGVTTMLLDEGMDTGDILLSAETGIKADDTAATLHDRLAGLGADLLLKTIDGLTNDRIVPRPQDPDAATYAPMLKKNDGRIDWHRPAEAIEAFIRGMTPWPGAFTEAGTKRYKIFSALPCPMDTPKRPGTVINGFSDELRVATSDGALCIREIQGASGKRMAIEDFLRGRSIPEGTLLH